LFTLLMRLRQTCDHPVLVLSSLLEKQSLQSLLSGQRAKPGGGAIDSMERSTMGDGCASVEDSSLGNNENDGNNNSKHSRNSNCNSASNRKTFDRIKNQLLGQEQQSNVLFLNDVLKSLERSWQVPGEFEETSTAKNGSNTGKLTDSRNDKNTTHTPIEEQECCVCFELLSSPDDTALTPCGHLLCWTCATLALEQAAACPLCQRTMTRQELIPLGERRVEEDIEQWLLQEAKKEKEDKEASKGGLRRRVKK